MGNDIDTKLVWKIQPLDAMNVPSADSFFTDDIWVARASASNGDEVYESTVKFRKVELAFVHAEE